MLRDIGFSASDGWLLLLVGCAGIYLAFLMYRSRLQGIHRLLLGVRVAALVLLIGLLMEPILALTLHTQRLPLVALLIDDSESMKIADGDIARFEVAKAVLNDPSLKNLRDRARVTPLSVFRCLNAFGRGRRTHLGGESDRSGGCIRRVARAYNGRRACRCGAHFRWRTKFGRTSRAGSGRSGRASHCSGNRRSSRAQRCVHSIGGYRSIGLCGQVARDASARTFFWI